ncbi:pH-response regulator protein palI/prr-5 [Cladobotryum mycophilum]|uniref:PH-response regulator protein palI/prr-5 n=1 Tax=Cladobotryum mycophilum TaxID=491253 RepID=A0ABR0T2Y9_9HYPO
MLRPATPLSVFLGVAFILLLLSVLSTPVIQAIPLGSYKDATFGVFGYCTSEGCSSIGLGYDLDKISTGDSQSFDLPSSTRNTLSTILVLHPIAAFLTLIMVIMAAATHIHSASHSSRYLLVFFIFLMIDFIVCLAAFVVDLLLFLPHQAWGTYIVLAATILVFVCGVGSCAMRRTLISRKTRRRKVEENAEMNGESYYNAGNLAPKSSFITSSQPTVPMVSGANGSPDTLPAFATFEHQKKDDQMSDEHIPLTQRTNSERSPPSMHSVPADMPPPGEIGVAHGGPRRAASQDQYGQYANGSPDPYGAARGPSYERMNRGGRRSTDPPANYRGGPNGGYVPPYMRGRGGYGQPVRGGYGPRGGRGGYGPPARGIYGPGGMRGGGRSPPPGHNNMAGPYDRRPYPGPQAPYGGHPLPASDPSLNRSTSNGNGTYTAYTPNFDLPRAESPPPLPGSFPDANSNYAIGQAIEMDATPATTTSSTPAPYGQMRDSDTDVAGMVGLQQGRMPEQQEPYVTAESHYRDE